VKSAILYLLCAMGLAIVVLLADRLARRR